MTMTDGDFCMYLRNLAGTIWDDQNEAFSNGLTLHEDALTEYLLLNTIRKLKAHGLGVRMFTRHEEGGITDRFGQLRSEGNGADWEWLFYGSGCSVGFRVQAKRLGQSTQPGSYQGIKNKPHQIQWLISKARSARLNPIYLFYNHAQVSDANRHFTDTSGAISIGRSAWGCAIATANFVQKAKSEKLADLRKGMVPWHEFFRLPVRHPFTKELRCPMRHVLGSRKEREDLLLNPEFADRRVPWGNEEAEQGYLLENDLKGFVQFNFSELV